MSLLAAEGVRGTCDGHVQMTVRANLTLLFQKRLSQSGIEFEIISACETQCSAPLRNVKYTSMNNKCGRTPHRMSLPAAEAVSGGGALLWSICDGHVQMTAGVLVLT
ncbi:hypothetical protein CEXT_802971 [Caerostris extrusa]|uniref:Uncharacterized protein n=1 Tax=Caerostris extrusa TaxID=172846 RepID=A0AAV4MAA2_CAEEX|nr:hypothetical protein CEXT_802971 [Caerostris extrusa]